MKLEAVDPLKTSVIRVATVSKILKSGYIMISIDRGENGNSNNTFCRHRSSSLIFPINFCKSNNIKLTPPNDDEDFNWSEYLRMTESIAVPHHLFKKHQQSKQFAVGMKLEAVDLQLPNLISVATVKNVIGRLLLIGFDSWDSTYDQWMDEESTNIFPVGWCELVGHQLLPPKSPKESPLKKILRPSTRGKSRKRRGTKRKF